jgi:hypothetical protein
MTICIYNVDDLSSRFLQASRHFNQIDRFWESASADVQNVYTKQYMKDQIDIILNMRQKLAAKSPDAVIDAVMDAVTSSTPQCRYPIHGGPLPIDPIVVS